MIKFICCSDTHGIPAPNLPEEGAFAWLYAGDVYNEIRSSSPARIERTLRENNRIPLIQKWAKDRTIPIFAVSGNHDCADPCRIITTQLGADVTRLKDDLVLVSLGWHGEEYYDLPTESDLRDLCTIAMKKVERIGLPSDKYIVLTHFPPCLPAYGDSREGYISQVLYKFCLALKPIVVVSGHVDGLFGTQNIDNETLYIVCGPVGGVLTINDDMKASYVEGDASVALKYLNFREYKTLLSDF